MRVALDDVDLEEVTRSLQQRFAGEALAGYLDGRTVLRDAVAVELECSDLEAEEIVDTLVARGFIRYEGNPRALMQQKLGWKLG